MDQKFPFDHFLNFNHKSHSAFNKKELEDLSLPSSSNSQRDAILNTSSSTNTPTPVSTPLDFEINFEITKSDNSKKDMLLNKKKVSRQSSLDTKSKFSTSTLGSQLTETQNHSQKETDEKDLTSIHNQILSLLKDLIIPQKFNAYFQDCFHLKNISQQLVTFKVNTNFIKTIIENQYLAHIQESVKSVLGHNYDITIAVDTNLKSSQKKLNLETFPSTALTNIETDHSPLSSLDDSQNPLQENHSDQFPSLPSLQSEITLKKTKKLPSLKDVRFKLDLIPSQNDLLNQIDSTVLSRMENRPHGQFIDPRKCFENFIVGPSNNMAYASLMAVTKGPGKTYPCLFLHSGSGLGKTHLLIATANKIRELHPHLKVHLKSARDFMTEMIEAMTHKRVSEFRKRYSDQVDVLIIDDIHDLRNKSGTQNEFFHIFNELYNKGKQVIITSDRPPKSIDGLEERIKTRLSWGLVLDIQEPDIETRIAILKKKADEEDINLSDDVLSLIANSVQGNIRELEGSLIRLGAFASVMKVDIDFEIAKEQLNIVDFKESKKLDMENITKSVSTHFNIPMADIFSKVRLRNVTQARHVAMFLSHKLLQETLTRIALFFGKKDHTSVLHAIDKVKEQMDKDPDFAQLIQKIQNCF